MRSGFADARSRPDHDDYLPIEFLFGRHASQLGFFQVPVFDVESLLLIHGFVLIDRFRAAHHFDRAVVELRSDARFALVLAPREHSQPWNQHYSRIRIAHRRRVRTLALVVIRFVILSILNQTVGDRCLQLVDIAARRIPIDEERFDLSAEKMIRA